MEPENNTHTCIFCMKWYL